MPLARNLGRLISILIRQLFSMMQMSLCCFAAGLGDPNDWMDSIPEKLATLRRGRCDDGRVQSTGKISEDDLKLIGKCENGNG